MIDKSRHNLKMNIESEVETKSVQWLPYDILREIFLLCLPPFLCQAQPNSLLAPMVLCRVCSYWRFVALSTGKLWADLYHIAKAKQGSTVADGLLAYVIRDFDRHFLQWWKDNIGGYNKLSLRLAVIIPNSESSASDDSLYSQNGGFQLCLTEKDQFLIDLMQSAVYLDLDHHYSLALRQYHRGYQPLCSRLTTLCMRQAYKRRARLPLNGILEDLYSGSEGRYDTPLLLCPVKVNNIIRRLYIEDLYIPTPISVGVAAWSNLAEVCAINICLSTNTWFELIRGCLRLVYGRFHIQIESHPDDIVLPRWETLPHLLQLELISNGRMLMESPFLNLRLPSLTALRIDLFPPVSISRLHDILMSTPHLKELHLGQENPSNFPRTGITIPGPRDTAVQPIQTVIPEIELIHFAGSQYRPRIPQEHNHAGNTEVWPRPLIHQLLDTPWINIGKEYHLQYLSFEEDALYTFEELEELTRGIIPSLPEGINVRVSEKDASRRLWKWRPKYDDVSCFGKLDFMLKI